MYSKRLLPDIEQWSQSSGSNVIPRRARPGLAGLGPRKIRHRQERPLCLIGRSRATTATGVPMVVLQGYLAYEKPPPRRTLQ